MTSDRTIDVTHVKDVLEEIMLVINNSNYEIYSAKDAVVDIIYNFTNQHPEVPYCEPTEQDYNDYAVADYEEDEDEEV